MTRKSCLTSMLTILIMAAGGQVSSVRAFDIFGTVTVEATGDPVELVEVQVYFNGNPVGGANDLTDINGEYLITGLPGATYDVDFQPPQDSGLRPKLVTGVVVLDNVQLDVTLLYAVKIEGYVRDTDGVGIPGIDLNIYDQESGELLDIGGDNTDEFGYYDVYVPPGLFRIVYRPVNGERYVPVEMTYVNIVQDTTIDVVLEDGFFIQGTVTGPNGVVADADIDAEDTETGLKLYTPGDHTDDAGHYHITLPVGVFNISVDPPPGVRLIPEIVYDYQVSQDGTLDFNMEFGFFLSGTVRDPVDAPVFNADINVTDVVTGVQVFTPGDQTDESGAYEVVIPGGLYDIDFRPQVGPPPYLACLRVENQNVSNDVILDVNVPYGVLLSGTVFDYNSEGVENVDIDAINSSSGISVPLFGDHTDSLGAFGTVLVADTYHLEIEPPSNRHLAAEKLYDYVLNTDSYIEVTLDSGMVVSGTVTLPDNNPMPDVKVIAVQSSTQEEAFTPGNGTDQNGHYEITLKPDTYDLTYSPDPVYGYSDSTIYDVDVLNDMVINVQFGEQEPDTEPPTVTVISPDGGESWPVFSNQTISWSASDNIGVTSVDIYYSADGPGGTYLLISSGESNDGNYPWTVPSTPTEDAWVKVIAFDAASNSGEDISDGAFTIYLNPSECSYEPGDVNHNGVPIELGDVVSMIGIYRGTVSPYYACSCPPHGDNFAPEADPNGNCTASELSDVVTEIGAYRGTASAVGCVDCPGQRRLVPDGSIGSPASKGFKNRIK